MQLAIFIYILFYYIFIPSLCQDKVSSPQTHLSRVSRPPFLCESVLQLEAEKRVTHLDSSRTLQRRKPPRQQTLMQTRQTQPTTKNKSDVEGSTAIAPRRRLCLKPWWIPNVFFYVLFWQLEWRQECEIHAECFMFWSLSVSCQQLFFFVHGCVLLTHVNNNWVTWLFMC